MSLLVILNGAKCSEGSRTNVRCVHPHEILRFNQNDELKYMQKLIVIVGPTASGKTKLAVELARKFNGEIVSADSRQVYKGMDIGTGKDLQAYQCGAPSQLQGSSFARSARCRRSKCCSGAPPRHACKEGRRGRVPYHLINIVSPRTNFTLAQYQRRAYRAIEDILRRGKVPILVGGTGLYVQAVVDGYVLPEAPPNPVLRARFAKLSLKQLRVKLKKLDPAAYRTIDKNNRRRMERAIEICLVSGVPLSRQRAKHPPPYDVLMLGIAVPKAELHRRIDKRLRERLKQGMAEEVKQLHAQGVSWKRLESFGLEYRHISWYLLRCKGVGKLKHATRDDRHILRAAHQAIQAQGDDSYNIMVRELSAAIRDFARRQMTWFKRDKRIVWVKNKKQAERLVVEFLM